MRNCKNCGQQLPRDATSRRKYCDDTCRVQFSRKNKAQSSYNIAMNEIYRLGRVPSSGRGKAIEALRDLKKAIDFELRNLGDKETLEKYQMLQNLRR